MLHDILLALHIAAGAAGLVLGPVALWRSGGRRPVVVSAFGRAYIASVLGVSLTTFGLVSLDWSELWGFTILAAFSSALAILAFLAPRLRFPGWARACARGEGGSYIALVTALLVVSVDGPASVLAWIAPTLLGVPLVRIRAVRLSEPRTSRFLGSAHGRPAGSLSKSETNSITSGRSSENPQRQRTETR